FWLTRVRTAQFELSRSKACGGWNGGSQIELFSLDRQANRRSIFIAHNPHAQVATVESGASS
ncbi:MAG: hypothetical protein KIS86_19135, partial [Devosia sp.]|nr:hypothetical protein [Opitutaceae bacterium]MCW5723251.1 hypothetical protein [Devosia sp.]